MKLLISFITILLVVTQDVSMSTVRKLYKATVKKETKLSILEDKLSHIDKNNTNMTLVAYKGAVMALKSKGVKGAKQKRSMFIEAVGYIEHAIAKDPKNIECRFIRLGIQESIPKFLKYNKHIKEDKTFILNHFNKVRSANLKEHIRDFIKQSKSFTVAEKQLFAN